MTQAQKKIAAPQQAASKARASAENVLAFSSTAMKDLLASSADEAQKAQEKVFALSREGAEHLAKSADAVSKAVVEGASLSRDNMETAIECCQMSAAMCKDMGSEIMEYSNRAFSDNVELSKEFFACRTISDMVELQNRMVKSTLDNLFGQTTKLSNMMFEYSTEALEPINERMHDAAKQISKVFSK